MRREKVKDTHTHTRTDTHTHRPARAQPENGDGSHVGVSRRFATTNADCPCLVSHSAFFEKKLRSARACV